MSRLSAVLIAVVGLIAGISLADAGPAAANTTALQVTAVTAPQRVHGSDGREHIEYDLVSTNSLSGQVTLTSLVVRSQGKRLLTLRGNALAAATQALNTGKPTTTIPGSSAVATFVDVVLPRSAGRSVPRRLHTRITYASSPGSPLPPVIGSRTVHGPDLRVDRRVPLVIAPPLRGEGWLSANGCCGDASLPHRFSLLPANGTYVAFETFAVDWVRVVNGRIYSGDGSDNSAWFGYGVPVHAVADGTVVAVKNDRPEVPPFINNNPTLNKPGDYSGNGVVERIRPGVFADYYHFQPGSVSVKVGQRLRAGQKLGLLGNSGNTTGPHLHFGIVAGRNPLTSNSLPFEIGSYRFEGTAAIPGPGEVTVTGKPHREKRSHPLATSVSDFSR
jgi:hypothetical protein